jgi:hypothetical protein
MNLIAPQHLPTTPLSTPLSSLLATNRRRQELASLLDHGLPMTPTQYAAQLIEQRWGASTRNAILVDLNYDFYAHPPQGDIHQGRARTSQSLAQVLLRNYQTVGAGRFGETAFGLYTPPAIGPQVRIVDIDESSNPGGGYRDYEGIYRQTTAQVYGPTTQLALQPAAFKQWVWTLDFQELYAAYVASTWPDEQTLLGASAYPLRTSVKLAYVMAAYLQHQENSLSDAGLALALRAAGLDARQTWAQLSIEQLQAATHVPSSVQAAWLVIYRYTSDDIACFTDRASGQILLYVPGNAAPFHEFANHKAMCDWVVGIARQEASRQALAAHFADDDQQDGTFHAGVLTALDAMAIYPRHYQLKKAHGFFNNDGYWPPEDYLSTEVASRAQDPFAQWVRVMKRAAEASIQTIRTDAQVNRDDLSAVVEPILQWVNRFAPLALLVPGGEGLLALAGLIDAGYGLDEAIEGKTTGARWSGVGRTLFGLLNALPAIHAGALMKTEEQAVAAALPSVAAEVPLVIDHAVSDAVTALDTVQSRIVQLRRLVAETAQFSDETLQNIDQVCGLDANLLARMADGHPPPPIVADTLNRFGLDQQLQQAIEALPANSVEALQAQRARVGQFNQRYAASQHSDHEWVKLFQSQYPDLPKSAIEQMLDRSGIDIAAPHTLAEAKRVLSELSGKAAGYTAHVRLARAYEGLHLGSVINADSDVLALHSLERLAGWSPGTRIVVCESSAVGPVLDSIGPRGAPYTRQLIKLGEAYQGREGGPAVDFYQAVLDALSPSQRLALGLRAEHGVADLRGQIRATPLARTELEIGLQRLDSGLPFNSEGLRGGGYPHTPQAESFTLTFQKLQLKELYPSMTDAQLEARLAQWGENAQRYLVFLNQQIQQLRTDLRAWVNEVESDVVDMQFDLLDADDLDAAGMDPPTLEAENLARIADAIRVERDSRKNLANQLAGLWQRRSVASNHLYSDGQFIGFRLNLDLEYFHKLPVLSVTLNEVVELSMPYVTLSRPESLSPFLQAFPRLRVLNLTGTDLRVPNVENMWVGRLPAAIRQMPELTSLNLSDTGLRLSEEDAGGLSGLSQLTTLDMSANPLERPPLVLHLPALRSLNLRDTGIEFCPVGVLDHPYLQLLDLRDNRIDRIPAAVRTQSVGTHQLLLTGNPMNDEDSLSWISRHRQETGINVWMAPPSPDFAQPHVWLDALPAAQASAHLEHWQQLAAVEGSERFFGALDAVQRSADFRVHYPSLQQRVWQLVDAVAQLPALRQQIFEDIEWAASNADDPFASFEHLEARAAMFHAAQRLGQ